MKRQLLLITALIIISCQKVENRNKTIIVEKVVEKNTNIKKVERPKESKIVNPKFDLNLLFGIWTYNPNGPHADFELTRKSFYVVDYDGNRDMPYMINHDTIKVYYEDYVSVGIIKSVTKDTLKIDWDNTAVINCVNWKPK
jgi:hypothetical protein